MEAYAIDTYSNSTTREVDLIYELLLCHHNKNQDVVAACSRAVCKSDMTDYPDSVDSE